MTSNFATAMASNAKTWNGAKSLSTPDISGESSGRIALFFKAVRGLNVPRLYEYLREAANENIVDTFLLVFHIRDCRGGKGERNLGRRSLIWLFLNYPGQFILVAPLIAEYGRWDDLMELWPTVLDISNSSYISENYATPNYNNNKLIELQEIQNSIVDIMVEQLKLDLNQMNEGKSVSLCAKWAPTENDSYDRKYKVVNTLCKRLGVSLKNYRKKYITPLRQYIKIVERFMCEKRWTDIEYSKVPSCAMKRLKKAFEKHAPEQFNEWKQKLQKGEVEVKAKQLYPHELIQEIRTKNMRDIVCENQWKVIENDTKTMGSLKDSIFVCDVSGSMTSWDNSTKNTPSFIPMDVAIGLSLIGANTVEGVFHNHIITFSESPTFHVVKDTNLYDRYNSLRNTSWGYSTNIQATFDMILEKAEEHKLPQKDMPMKIIIVSDMQFDTASYNKKTNFQYIEQRYREYGYKRPQIIFWNVCGSSKDFPVSVNDNGTALISGFSPSIMKAIMNGKDFSPYTIMRETLDSERLAPVYSAVTNK